AGVAAVGADVGAGTVHLVALSLDEPPSVILSELLHPVSDSAIANVLRAAAVVAIDAPAGRSSQPHLGDRRLAAKFQRARCGEVALRAAGHAVPWVSPGPGDDLPPWMATGLEVWSIAEQLDVDAVETYPHAVFAELACSVLRHKQRPDGLVARARVLAPLLATPAWLPMWSHDGLDALAAAIVAWHAFHGTGRRVDCSGDEEWSAHDGSAIWLPPRPAMQRVPQRGPARRFSVIEGGADRSDDA
ncbi:MAG TPA: DUF429 domain-containing protein, partial [Acidimicrobiales bacterium]|nr:DUF429 domain-containing protein [Acidimicrobiales bacterium]